MKTLTFIVTLILSCTTISAQAPDTLWTKTFGGNGWDQGNSVQQTIDGGYIIAGYTGLYNPPNDLDVWIIKTDATGGTLWTKNFDVFFDDEGRSVQQTNDGGYIIAGKTGCIVPSCPGHFLLIKTDAYGTVIWESELDLDSKPGSSVQQTDDGGYIITGYRYFLIKTDSNGDTLWAKTFGEHFWGQGNCVQQTDDGGYIIAGTKEPGDVWLIKTDSNGDTLWTKTFGGSLNDGGKSVQQTIDGGYIIAGSTESYGADSSDVWLIKTDANGDTLWTRTFGGSDDDWGNSMQQTTDGGYIIAGSTESYGAGSADVWIIKTDVNGDTLWTKTLGGGDRDEGNSIQQTTDGGYIVTGVTNSYGAGTRDVWLIKLAPDVTSIDKNAQTFINSYQLHQNYPNPFNPSTTIEFALPKTAFVTLIIYNIAGEKVATLVSENLTAGSYNYQWEARGLASGMYFYRIEAGDFTQSRKMLLIR